MLDALDELIASIGTEDSTAPPIGAGNALPACPILAPARRKKRATPEHEKTSRWREGGDADLSVGCQVLNNGAPLHAVEAETSGAASYDEQQDIRYGAARGWVDRIVEPHRTREELITALQIASTFPIEGEYRTGVLQT